MKYNLYKITDIEIGDEVFFDDVYSGSKLTQSNYDEYWAVHSKEGNKLLINLRKEHYWSVDISEVRAHISLAKSTNIKNNYLKKRYSNTLLGSYLPAFFFIEIDTNNELKDLNTLSDEDKSTFYHEYTHFLQDLTTTYGLTNIINNVNVQKAVNETILSNASATTFEIPVSLENYPAVDAYDNLNFMFLGDIESDFDSYSVIQDVQLIENSFIAGYEDKPFVHVTYLQFGKIKSFCFGAINIMENMAFLIERNLYKNVKPPVYPYRIVEKLIEFVYPEFKPDDLTIVTLCDYSLMAVDPGRFMFQFLQLLKKEKIKDKPGMYDVLRKYKFHSANKGELNVFELYESSSRLALQSLKDYFTIEYFVDINKWFELLFADVVKFRLENFNFWDNILEKSTMEGRRNQFNSLINPFGFPLMTNNLGDVVFNHSKVYPKDLLALRAIYDVSNVIYNREQSCSMRGICRKAEKGDITTANCATPWLKVNEPNGLCPFAQIIKMWGIYAKTPVAK